MAHVPHQRALVRARARQRRLGVLQDARRVKHLDLKVKLGEGARGSRALVLEAVLGGVGKEQRQAAASGVLHGCSHGLGHGAAAASCRVHWGRGGGRFVCGAAALSQP